MSDKAFFDTNVLVYVVAQTDERTPKADALIAKGGVISVQVLNELASVSRRKLGMSWEEIGNALAAIRVSARSRRPSRSTRMTLASASQLSMDSSSTTP